ncbi:MAG: TetR/AcrR family transcriptional regulator [Hyphomonadaceae bacterium]|nr:TetR/AcrR family transcriptional regulator [Hyphomonadaceae bacterium]
MSETSSSPKRPKSRVESAETSPKWRRRAEARPAEIVEAAYEVFSEKGFAAAKLDDIAARAGVSKGALYLYFETKQEIFEAVVKQAVAPNIGAIEQMALGFPGPFEQLIRMMVPRVAELADKSNMGRVIKMVVGESGNFPEIARVWHDDVIAVGIGLLTKVIVRAQERGEVRAGDPRQYAISIIGPLLTAVIFRETFVPTGAKPFDIPALMQQHLETLLPGLLTTSART